MPLVLEQFNHMNQIVPDYQEAVDHYRDVFGAQFLWRPTTHPRIEASLMNFGGAIFEYVAPRSTILEEPSEGVDLTSFWWSDAPPMFIADFPRLGGHFAGVEFKVPDVNSAIVLAQAQGFRVLDQRTWRFFLTHGEECHGVSFELYDGDWYSTPSPPMFVEQLKPASYWSDEHPLGITDFRFTIAVNDLEQAASFFANFCGATKAYEENRSDGGGRAVGLSFAGMTVELIAPTGAGAIQRFLTRRGEGIRSMVFEVKDIAAVQDYFAAKDIPLRAGDVPKGLVVAPESNLGVLYEFVA